MVQRFWDSIGHNSGTKVISVIVAIMLWVVVLGSRNVEVNKEIPLEIITPSEIVPANEIPEKISFRLAGPKAFLRAILDRREDPIRVNLSGAKAGLVTYRFFSDNIRLPIGVKVLSINPTAILIKLEPLKRRDVPVRLELRGIPPEGYRIAKTEIQPAVVRIKGAESKVDAITEVSTMPIDVSSLTESFEREVSLDLTRMGVQVDGPLPKIQVEIEPTEANYRIRDVDIRVLSSRKYTIKNARKLTVLVRASAQALESINRSKVYGVVDLRGKPAGTYQQKVKIELPEGIDLARVTPERVTVVLH